LLRPGDNADIGWIAIMFTDLKGSTELYDALGDVTAYNLVRDHFDFLLERVKRNHGFVVKTVGDAVMAAFSRPDDAVRAALAIQDDIASFKSARGGSINETPIVLKLGIHAPIKTKDTLSPTASTNLPMIPFDATPQRCPLHHRHRSRSQTTLSDRGLPYIAELEQFQ
jgi:hypothetical protein